MSLSQLKLFLSVVIWKSGPNSFLSTLLRKPLTWIRPRYDIAAKIESPASAAQCSATVAVFAMAGTTTDANIKTRRAF